MTPNPWQRRVVRRTHSVSSCPESARPAAQDEAAPEERPASVAEDNSTAPPEDKPASVADDGNRLRAQADLPPASHTQSPSKSTSNGHSDEPLPSFGASVIAASSSADDLAMADGAMIRLSGLRFPAILAARALHVSSSATGPRQANLDHEVLRLGERRANNSQ